MMDSLEKLIKRFLNQFRGVANQAERGRGDRRGKRDGDRDRDRRNRSDKERSHKEREGRRERLGALSDQTRWAVVAEVEYEIERDSAGRPSPTTLMTESLGDGSSGDGQSGDGPWGSGDALSRRERAGQDSASPGEAMSVSPGPVPGGGAAFGAGAGGAELVDDSHGSGDREHNSRDRRRWVEKWEAEGLLSHDGVSLRFQSWDGRRHLDVPIRDLTGRVDDDDELTLTAADYRLKIEDIEAVSSSGAGQFREPSRQDPFAGLLEDFPNLVD